MISRMNLLLVLALIPSLAFADANLELPLEDAAGVDAVAGWKCPRRGKITAEIDGATTLEMAVDLSRGDTAERCGNSGRNGFMAQLNYALLGDGSHEIVMYDAGQEFARRTFRVQTLENGFPPFVRGLSGRFELTDFPVAGKVTVVEWQQATQRFGVVEVRGETSDEMVYTEDFEGGIGFWSADNGIWQVGTPSVGPDECVGGDQCAGTVLDGNYPRETESRLISRSLRLPNLASDGEIQLRFSHWFSFAACGFGPGDGGWVQISAFDDATDEWDEWETLSDKIEGLSGSWSVLGLDLTAYAGKRVRLGFYFGSFFRSAICSSTGWYIDDVEIFALDAAD